MRLKRGKTRFDLPKVLLYHVAIIVKAERHDERRALKPLFTVPPVRPNCGLCPLAETTLGLFLGKFGQRFDFVEDDVCRFFQVVGEVGEQNRLSEGHRGTECGFVEPVREPTNAEQARHSEEQRRVLGIAIVVDADGQHREGQFALLGGMLADHQRSGEEVFAAKRIIADQATLGKHNERAVFLRAHCPHCCAN